MLPFFRRGERLDGGGESFRPQGKTKRLVFLTKDFCFCRNCLLLTKRALFLTELFLFAVKPVSPKLFPQSLSLRHFSVFWCYFFAAPHTECDAKTWAPLIAPQLFSGNK